MQPYIYLGYVTRHSRCYWNSQTFNFGLALLQLAHFVAQVNHDILAQNFQFAIAQMTLHAGLKR